jgi:deoxyribose-phosphate aldolase
MNTQISSLTQVPANFTHIIDVSVHRANTPLSDIREMCRVGLQEGFNVISNSCFTPYVRQYVGKDAPILVGATVGFPFGTASTTAKASEAKKAVEDGADEVDMVLAVGYLREGPEYYQIVEDDVRAVVNAVHAAGGKATKVIIETCYLTDAEKEVACKLVTNAGAEFVKTSTGYGPAGATLADVRLMRRVAGPQVKVKAAGGIRTLSQCLEYLDAGAVRLGIGLQAALSILEEARQGKARSDSQVISEY